MPFYYEAVFFLVALDRATPMNAVLAGSNKGKTPDFVTSVAPTFGFEVKTIDVASPGTTYDQSMRVGLDAKIEAQEKAVQTGVGIVATSIRPHGSAQNRREVIEQVMKKIDGNVKAGQYIDAPTFLVVATARANLHDRAENLRRRLPFPNNVLDASGQLFAIAAHAVDEPFYFFEEWGDKIKSLGLLNRAGILRDHPFIAGLIFLQTAWTSSSGANSTSNMFTLNGIWNTEWENNNSFGAVLTAQAKAIFDKLCHNWNDSEDTRHSLLPLS